MVQVKRLATPADLRARAAELGIELPVDDVVEPGGVLSTSFTATDGSAGTLQVGNRWTVLPMEGWDGTPDGLPTDLVRRRWRRFGESGAKLIWGGEAIAVEPDGRANPHQLAIGPGAEAALADLRSELVGAHAEAHGTTSDLVVGLQLTHSGRWSRPSGAPAPRTAWTHPVLDSRLGSDHTAVLADDELDGLVARYVRAAEIAADAGFAFVDVKHCHGYLLHELLAAHQRPGRYGGALDHRLRFLTAVVEGIRRSRPDLAVGVRISAYDLRPFEPGADGRGRPVAGDGMPRPFGGSVDGSEPDLGEVHQVLRRFRELGIGLVCVTAGSPYYVPHIQRPAYFPPSDGYQPPTDPLVDVARLLQVTAALTHEHPDLAIVGSGYSYLQDHVAHVAQAVVERGDATSIGLGRMMLSYPTLPADSLAGRALDRRAVCRTFSDCTTAPRHGLVSGCYPLDEEYKDRPERIELAAIKRRSRQARPG
ncbi:MAG: NADH:flavin oxidoreductase [Acidimicrobiales bacterium]|nr:NADH:flavin oxidoreductase [Acidimicrobiales bacterium]